MILQTCNAVDAAGRSYPHSILYEYTLDPVTQREKVIDLINNFRHCGIMNTDISNEHRD